MRFLIVIFWAVIISGVLSYVLSSMASAPFNGTHTLVLAVILSIVVFILGEGVLTESEE